MASYHLSIKNGKRGSAANHAAYIARVGKYGACLDTPDLVALEHGNLPEWANGDPLYFFKMSDAGERANGAAYRELEIALPSELTQEQQQELAREFVGQVIGPRPYLLALHSPTAALGGVPQDHMHAMFSDRMPDGIERPPESFFSRFNPIHPELGGCKKSSGGKDRGELKGVLMAIREDFAELQNKHLKKYGHPARVDHRSNRDRGIETDAERHLGSGGIKSMTAQEKERYKENRKGLRQAVA
ncbi:hypothetical protein A3H38_01470 [candidate division WOR-1 bacterium RIFCSPLOWO2_02_FULL_46_20]|uniref:MobA/MobL protein domain-containing protein n=1 Tax=candidate division WOR-1 bacterium RIFCSPLOWO2_02_FULL_46_20 TaxID=1802567 RepID=A0A1F4RBQ8_UNCSA|nr:MAG: hypothetical protein A3H38_01470 [candidate division WOR-1 bacterium RIFCSPLOWO2_02_FULL_46_20]